MTFHDYTDQYWGHAIGLILDTKQAGVYSMMGHGFGIKDGDALTMKMQSGRVGQFDVSKVEYKSNPRDLWSLEAKFTGYVDSDGRAADAAETRDAKGGEA